ncbi:circularly permuted type 2 ATP-grasp protein [Nakamurella leprariae]|uniref:Circularly permuted type 2 ATP-grasp protein n=1 Tax=Nakamurella leprariae TaxID=2803911 RepID=A0A938YFS2_9ACTN|nr:circularly permuted type 2 ATP-grasp protein [Nakamurella leprariae]MBM9467013.1 circularly permuted type 2 ATP-grasp protein [Nakamurella leprariae]
MTTWTTTAGAATPGPSVVQAYLTRTAALDAPAGGGFDELSGQPGAPAVGSGGDPTPAPGWSRVAEAADRLGPAGLRQAAEVVERLLEDDGVTYTPLPPLSRRGLDDPGSPDAAGDVAAGRQRASQPARWRLDPLPLVLDAADWAVLQPGLAQRARVLNALLADLYGRRRVLADGLLPPELVFGHDGYVRAAHGITVPGPHQLVFCAADVCRAPDGSFQVLGDRTQAPSGSGYAMAGRRVLDRALPDLVRQDAPRGLSSWFSTVRLALTAVAPTSVEDPRIVVLSPGTHSETAFDQAFLASELGVPLVESADLLVRGGRLWMRSMGRLEPVDVVVRRVDAGFSDPLELRPDSQLGVVGLTEACRRGAVTVVNTLGSGVLENPGLLPFLPRLAEALLDEPLSLPSVPTFWCGEPTALDHVVAHLDTMLLRPVGRGRSIAPDALSRTDRERLVRRLRAEPRRWVGQLRVPPSEAPIVVPDSGATATLAAAAIGLRFFSVASGTADDSYTTMPGGLGSALLHAPPAVPTRARVTGGAPAATPAGTPSGPVTGPTTVLGGLVEALESVRSATGVAKDVWVRSARTDHRPHLTERWAERLSPSGRDEPPLVEPLRPEALAPPRVLEDLFWLGRYAERTEDLVRLLTATADRAQEIRDVAGETGAADPADPTGGVLSVLASALAGITGLPAPAAGADPDPWFRTLLLDGTRDGTVAHSLAGLRSAARAVRDQLSGDTWAVLGGADRALAALAGPAAADRDAAGVLRSTGEQVLVAMLALTGLAAENMVRDPGWWFLDLGRRLERSLQLTALLGATLVTGRSPAATAALAESVLTAAESVVTHRRRYRGHVRVGTVVQMLLLDPGNPRSLVFQIGQALIDLRELPGSASTSRPSRLLEEVQATLRRSRPADLDAVGPDGTRAALGELLDATHRSLRTAADAVAAQWFWRQRPMRSIDVLGPAAGTAR